MTFSFLVLGLTTVIFAHQSEFFKTNSALVLRKGIFPCGKSKLEYLSMEARSVQN